MVSAILILRSEHTIDVSGQIFALSQARHETIDNIAGTEIRESKIHGLGLFATKHIPTGVMLCKLDGQVVEYDAYQQTKIRMNLNESALNSLFMEWNALSENKLLARMFRTKYSYINHSRLPNLKLIGSPPELWSVDDIQVGAELLLNYRDEQLPKNYVSGHGATYL